MSLANSDECTRRATHALKAASACGSPAARAFQLRLAEFYTTLSARHDEAPSFRP